MNNKATCALAFMVGAAIGAVATWKFVETKYKRIAQEEIDSVKEVFSRRKTEIETEPAEDTSEDEREEPSPEEVNEYKAKVNKLGYTHDEYYEEKGERLPMDRPYVISPDEFGENHDYELAALIYYADGVLEDNFGEVVENIDELIGRESLDHFGDYGEDTVFVRNDVLKTDYEIAYDIRRYVDVPKITLYSNGE